MGYTQSEFLFLEADQGVEPCQKEGNDKFLFISVLWHNIKDTWLMSLQVIEETKKGSIKTLWIMPTFPCLEQLLMSNVQELSNSYPHV